MFWPLGHLPIEHDAIAMHGKTFSHKQKLRICTSTSIPTEVEEEFTLGLDQAEPLASTEGNRKVPEKTCCVL
jgi:hypothetical protein